MKINRILSRVRKLGSRSEYNPSHHPRCRQPMPVQQEFDELILRVRKGDADAARDLVEQFEAMIRRVVRYRLADSRLRAAFDSMDVCQSVLGSFFVRAANGEYEIDGPEQLTHL